LVALSSMLKSSCCVLHGPQMASPVSSDAAQSRQSRASPHTSQTILCAVLRVKSNLQFAQIETLMEKPTRDEILFHQESGLVFMYAVYPDGRHVIYAATSPTALFQIAYSTAMPEATAEKVKSSWERIVANFTSQGAVHFKK